MIEGGPNPGPPRTRASSQRIATYFITQKANPHWYFILTKARITEMGRFFIVRSYRKIKVLYCNFLIVSVEMNWW